MTWIGSATEYRICAAGRGLLTAAASACLFVIAGGSVAAERLCEERAVREFNDAIRPILEQRCYGCHGGGASEGSVTLDAFDGERELLDTKLWLRVLKNVRAGIMPPTGEERLSAEELATLEKWIKFEAFGIDPENPDPGHAVLRRLNRHQYRNTILDLLGHDYPADEIFPADDTGHGFDNIGSLLSTSPLLIEKYLQAASEIVRAVVPETNRGPRERIIAAATFVGESAGSNGINCEKPGRYAATVTIDEPGTYAVHVEFKVFGHTFYTTETAEIRILSHGELLHSEAYSWQRESRAVPIVVYDKRHWQPGEKELVLEVEPHTGDGKTPKRVPLTLEIVDVRVQGPLEEEHWVTPSGYERFFPRPQPPEDMNERRAYAAEILREFTSQAIRRPVDDSMLTRLVDLAEGAYSASGTTFEQGVQQAMIAVLCSRPFLFRVERPAELSGSDRHPLVDEFTLASRLSYLLWNSMPDEELFALAEQGELRNNLEGQVGRMLDDPRSNRFVESFVGQWLRTREVDSVEIDARLILARDANVKADELAFRDDLLQRFLEKREKEEREFLKKSRSKTDDESPPDEKPADEESGAAPSDETTSEDAPASPKPPQLPSVNLDEDLRTAMRKETELCFLHVLHENRSLLELLDSDYTFLNARLAAHYRIEGVEETEMRKVKLPEDGRRGGLLTHAGILMLTSQSTRTSAVKRGTFVLDNLLGTPAPPPPPNIPTLEDAGRELAGEEPTLREMLEWHRRNPVCASCHQRMDPIGLALENFNALGLWRTEERGKPINVEGELITGETLTSAADLQKILVNERRTDYYRCLAEKLMIYALGRGLEYYDVHAVDQIVDRLNRDGGRARSLLMGVIESAPFQRCRVSDFAAGAGLSKSNDDKAKR